ncbi:cytochrome P450 [Mycena albidolilacea]|uniref:Cytochrome P450 n=1 Tax=Mycena albidolilacea TaxID=1033008 RepID=A0AAD7ER25_9AGAR|nr:cytochrome P450 [Mycena albidolilacea]
MVFTPLPSIAIAGISAAVSMSGKLPIAPRSEVSWWLGREYLVAKNEAGVEFGRWTQLLGPVFRIKSALWQAGTVSTVKALDPNSYAIPGRDVRFFTPGANPDTPGFQTDKGPGVDKELTKPSDHMPRRHLESRCTLTVRETVCSALAAEFTSTSPASQPIVVEFVGHAVGWAEGDEHKFQCRMISPAFSSRRVFNMCDYIPAVTLGVIRRVGFGYDLGPDSPEGGAILDAWKTDVARCAPWVANLPIDVLQDGVAKKLIHEVGQKMHQEPPNMDGTDMFSILVPRFETTSGTIHLILLDLAQHPDVQRKLREEILAAYSSEVDVIEGLPYLDTVTREGPRLHPCVRDTHRVAAHDDIIPLKSPVTLTSGETITSLPVQAGDSFIIPFMVPNTDPDVWGPDGARVILEPWVKGGNIPNSEDLPHGLWGNISNFADGPRHSIGWLLDEIWFFLTVVSTELRSTAIQEIKLIVGALVKKF